MPQTEIKPYQPSKRTEELVYREDESDEAPLVLTVRSGLTHGEYDPLSQWYRSVGPPDPDDLEELPEGDDEESVAERRRIERQRRRDAKERMERAANVHGWPMLAPLVLGWNVVDENGDPVPPPAEAGPDAFDRIPSAAVGQLIYHFLGISKRRLDAARKALSASGPTDAPSSDTAPPSEPETSPGTGARTTTAKA